MTLFERLCRTQVVLGLTGVAFGALGFVLAADLAFQADAGASIGWPDYEIRLMSYNRLAALITVILALVGLGGGLARRPVLGWIPTFGFGLLALQVLVQWRPGATNLLGSQGSNLAFALFLAMGFGSSALLSRSAAAVDAAASSS